MRTAARPTSARLSRPRWEAERPADPAPVPAVPSANWVLGGGLLLCGLVRGSWTGLALAAAGGFLLGRELLRDEAGRRQTVRSHPTPPTARDAVDTGWARGAERGEPAAGHLVTPEIAAPVVPTPPGERAGSDGALRPEEHEPVRVGAYYLSLERGGGCVPPYDPALAVADFCRAAAAVVAAR